MACVLLLDDDVQVLSALRRCVRQHLPRHSGQPVHCIACADPLQALAQLEHHAFDLVLSDFRMPGMDGLEFLGQVRARQPQAVRMMLSATSDTSTLISAVNEVAVFRYLVKPWEVLDLIDALTQGLAHGETRCEQSRLANAMRRRLGAPAPGVPVGD